MNKKTVQSICKYCKKEFTQPRSRVWRDKFCSSNCGNSYRKEQILSRTQECGICNTTFIPRPYQLKIGHGKYCSKKCRNEAVFPTMHTPEAKKKREGSFKQALETGKYIPLKGEQNPKWTGGQEATIRRRIESGKAAESTRNYRQKNPDKIREIQQSRRAKHLGKIPRGLVKRLLKEQDEQCAYCGREIPPYHLDHKLPVARGGTNIPENLHLTCPRCNVRKHTMTHEEFLVSKKFSPKERKII